jgi:DNA topoisomerase-1
MLDSAPLDTPSPELEPREAARAAKLRYVNDSKPGITRRLGDDGKSWRFFKPDGSEIICDEEVGRIRKLAIPPAYTDVWICPDPRGHLQAVGRDAKGRKQYRYHAKWRTVRDEAKYGKILVFGRVLPIIRARVHKDLALPGLPKRKVVAAIVALLEKTMMRVGNEEYAKQNGSFGLTTLRARHAKIKGAHVEFDFRGKHGVQHHIDLADRRLTKVVARCRDLPGQELFQFLDDDGDRHHVASDDVNEYLQEVSGEEITAKDFRTWAGTTLAAVTLRDYEAFDTEAAAKKHVLRAVEEVSKKLGNTPAICRKCYIHPAVFEGYLDGSLLEGLKERADEVLEGAKHGLTVEEVAITAYLSRRLGEAISDPKGKPLKT